MRCSLVSSVFRPLAPMAAGTGIRSIIRHHVRNSSLSAAFTYALLSGITLLSVGAPQVEAALPPSSSHEQSVSWSDDGQLRSQAIEALAVLTRAPEHGLPQTRYALDQLSALAQELTDGKHRALSEHRFNELLSAAIETYAIDLLQGMQPKAFKNKHDPTYATVGRETMQSQLQAAVLKALHRSIATNRVAKFLESIEPQHSDYQKLQEALAAHRTIAVSGGWPELPRSKSGKMLKPGDVDPRVAILRDRLAITAAFEPPSVQSEPLQQPATNYSDMGSATLYNAAHVYDAELELAVLAFQLRHGLKADGKVGRGTRAALNVSVEDRIRQLELNLDRWRLMPKVMPANHIWVNVPEYQLRLQLDREEVLDMRVVVGTRKTPTVMMHDQLDHVVFNPYWYPTRNISVGEILPKVKADINYLAANNFEVLDKQQPVDASRIDWAGLNASNFKYRFRQRPGNTNSLGKVKFMFPNRYSIYLHDTNAKILFNNAERALSHGCVRLEQPDALATAILDWDRGWNHNNVSRAMTGNRQKHVKLKQTLPVYLVYFTASVNNDTVYFHRDIYGHDARHTAAQEQAKPTLVAQLLARYDKPATPEKLSKNQHETASDTTQVSARDALATRTAG